MRKYNAKGRTAMAKLNLKTVNKKTKDQLITFVLVIAVYIVVQIMVAAGAISSLMQGLLVPMCTYSIVAIGLNLCVGYLGELSIGHAGFMCVGAFSSAFCTKMLEGVIGSQIVLPYLPRSLPRHIPSAFRFPSARHWPGLSGR